MRFAGAIGAGWLAVLSGACGGAPERGLRLLEFRQQDFGSVALNEELLFYFSEDLDPASITSDSVRILDAAGADVAGERVVRANALSFLPELPRAPDLSDGGLRAGGSYRAILGGFPRPDGIRGESGALLSASLRLEFATAEIGATSPLFLEPFVRPFPLRPAGKGALRTEFEDGRIVLEYGEALDPSTVPGSRFELLPPIPVTARLVENRRNRAVLVLEPDAPEYGGRLPPDRYGLHMPGRELRTLGGREVVPLWSVLHLIVPELRIEFDFSTKRERSTDLPPGCDSTALWNERGPGLRLAYPAAAGNGLAGPVALRECPPGPDLHAERLTVPAGSQVDLGTLVGPVVIRSQATLEVSGLLRRRAVGLRHDARPDPLTQGLERLSALPPSHWTNLSDWITALLDPDQPWSREPWTVLVAGGDIRIPAGGAIEVEGPLVLVAGGRIRVEGEAVARADIWMSCECGGMISLRGQVRELPLVLDEPATNPLRTTLRAGALTMEMPWSPRKGSWRQTFTGSEGSGRMQAQFLELLPGAARPRILSDPGEITGNSVRVLLQLEVAPGQGEPWNPPRFERLRLEAAPPPSFEPGGG